ncbi:MAG: TIGR04013 family B12-binding domain/radical SAM domain-containing protein [Candidatus Sumerlaeota bacterium]|nr:TIGR04013 family B12-binding domain/radical SAM domain-containing protein [Candidatus Sumerlaeota bacterium]
MLEVEGLLARLEVRLTGWEGAAAAFDEAHSSGQSAVLAFSLLSRAALETRGRLAALCDCRRAGDLIAAGGPHPTARPRETLEMGVGAVFAGEGEIAFADFIRRLIEGEDWRGAPNLRFLDGDRMVENPMAPPMDLDRAPSLVESLSVCGPMEITRGCRWGCRYCQTPRLWHGRERHRSIESAARLGESYRHYIQFLTPNALGYQSDRPGQPNVHALTDLLETIRRRNSNPRLRLNLGNFPSEVRPDYVTREALAALRPLLDNRVMAIGAQSGSPRMLKAIARGHTVDDVRRAVDICFETDFVPYVDVIFGLPGETEDEAAMTRALVSELFRKNARVRGHVFMPLPGSPFEDAAPSPISPETRTLLLELEHYGAADGNWREQLAR